METQQVNRTLNHLAQPPLVLTNLAQMMSSQGVLLQPKSEQEVMQAFEGILSKRECILDFQHLRMLQGAMEVDLFVVSSLALEQLRAKGTQNGHANSAPSTDASPASTPSGMQTEEKYEMIQEAIDSIFQYKNFHKDRLMAHSPLHSLLVVQQAQQVFLRQGAMGASMLSQRNRAIILRKFLTKYLDEQLCPALDNEPPKDLSNIAPRKRTQWIEYLILRRQYCDGARRKEVMQELENKMCPITGGTYTRHLQAARERLADIIWQKEKAYF